MRNISQTGFNARRRKVVFSALAASLVPCSSALAAATTYPELRLNLYNLHTTEKLNDVFWADGEYNQDVLKQLNHLLRDHRTDEVKQIDTKLFSILYLINQKLDNQKTVSIISGYRSAETNRKLARKNSAVARNSYHVKGRAVDIRIPGVATEDLRDAGMHLRVGGVGYYKKSNFTHLDTGPHRSW